ncbi:Mu-like prophage tail sheath protein gpL [Faunimonas pinastri]|uniref:Mu-like prophage tail sheath protein gpL n=1 Tax=Faunimonas pinastri TaxID=1855383 RepID=A0A1H9QB33_9HYPH|nr:phage tail sheath C-terminal domain-containing protein [Faunimonas pinastri]SER57099.1 Mu-like prophage tail sheath protein gpL [Faunimonas pinastri]
MAVSALTFPANWKPPLYYVEVDGSEAGLASTDQPALLVGTKLANGIAPANIPIAISSVATAKKQFGEGSMLERMVAAFLAINASTTLYCLPIDEPAAGVAAKGSITVTSVPTASGTYALYIGGQKISVAITDDDTLADVAEAIAAAVNAVGTLSVTAAVDGTNTAAVSLTAKFKGIDGNDIRIEDSILGLRGGESLPTGMAVTYPTDNVLAGGTGVPDWSTAIAKLGDEQYDFVGMPFTDTGSLSAWGTEYGFGQTGRWGWMRQIYGMVFSARRGSYSGLLAWGPDNNVPAISVLAFETSTPVPMWEAAAAYTAQAAAALIADPARPLQTLDLTGIQPAPKSDRFLISELNAIAGVGLAIQKTGSAGYPQILREQTTYQFNEYGQADDAYELVTTLATLMTIMRRQRAAITSKYPRHKLADNGTKFGAGQAIVTPNVIKAELVAEYRGMEYDGLVENTDWFKTNLIVERDNDNPNRVNVLFPPDIINQLRIFYVLNQFRLQANRGTVTD